MIIIGAAPEGFKSFNSLISIFSSSINPKSYQTLYKPNPLANLGIAVLQRDPKITIYVLKHFGTG